MELKEQLKEIKTQLRLSMNGAVSQSMREKGLVYKLNFGVELPRIKSIASAYGKDHALAQALWKEDIRECKNIGGIAPACRQLLARNSGHMGGEHPEHRDCGTYLYEPVPASSVCPCEVFSLDCR